MLQTSVLPDFDPAINNTKPEVKPETKNKKDDEEEAVVVRPADPIFRKPGFKRGDKTQRVKTPVWGIVTEPITGKMQGEWTEYVPSSHVKFLEQTGAKVVPISYNIHKTELVAILD